MKKEELGLIVMGGVMGAFGLVVLSYKAVHAAYRITRGMIDKEYRIISDVKRAEENCFYAMEETEVIRNHSWSSPPFLPRGFEHPEAEKYRKTLREAIQYYKSEEDIERVNELTARLNHVRER